MRPNSSMREDCSAACCGGDGPSRALRCCSATPAEGRRIRSILPLAIEHRDVHAGAVALTGAGLLLAIWLSSPLSIPCSCSSTAQGRRAAQAAAWFRPPQPRLQADPPRDLEEFRARENAAMNSYQMGGSCQRRSVDPDRSRHADRGAARNSTAGRAQQHDVFRPAGGNRQTGFEGKVANRETEMRAC